MTQVSGLEKWFDVGTTHRERTHRRQESRVQEFTRRPGKVGASALHLLGRAGDLYSGLLSANLRRQVV